MSKYPPCMMYAQPREKSAPKQHRKEPNLLKEFMKFQEFMDGMNKKAKEGAKQPDPPPTGKGMWHWVEDQPKPSYTTLETTAILLLMSIPVSAVEIYGGAYLLRLAGGG